MQRRGARLALAGLFAWLLVPLVTSSVSAECANLAIDPIDHVRVGVAFLATVTEVSDDVASKPDGGSPWDVHVEMSVEEVFRGQVPGSLAFNAYELGCGEFQTDRLEVGNRIIIAAEDVPLSYLPGAPFEGHIVVWKKADAGWAFFEEVLAFGSNPDFYAGAAREARTREDILRVISLWSLPETSTESDVPVPSPSDPALVGAIAIALGLLVAWRRFGPSSRDIARR
jgi:hypothetical protein